jgi:hypothetical protein
MISIMNFFKNTAERVDSRSISQFLALCFGLTWSIELSALAWGARFDQPGFAETALMAGVMFIPGLSAFLVLRHKTGSGKSRATWRLGPWQAYLLVWLAVPLAALLIYGLSWGLGGAAFAANEAAILSQLPPLPAGKVLPAWPVLLGAGEAASLTFGLLVTTLFTFGEEYGWTGFLLPSLLPLGKTRAVLLYGTAWGLWHAPLVFGGFNYPGHPFAGIAMMCLFTIAVGSVQCALLLRCRSVFLTSFLHGSINAQGRGALPLLFTGVHPLLGGIVGLTGCVVIGGIGAASLALLRRRPQDLGISPRPAAE